MATHLDEIKDAAAKVENDSLIESLEEIKPMYTWRNNGHSFIEKVMEAEIHKLCKIRAPRKNRKK